MHSFEQPYYWLVLLVLLTFCSSPEEEKSTASEEPPNWKEIEEGLYQWNLGDVSIGVDSQKGGRISTLTIHDFNLLTGPEVDSINYGSTLWLSPQSLWRWPPPATLDRKPYRLISARDSLLHLQSMIDERFGLSFKKMFFPSQQDTSLRITYTIHNHTDSVRQYAIWEVTRMHKDSEVLFNLEEENSLRSIKEKFWEINDKLVSVNVTEEDTLTNKMYANGQGWLIYRFDSLALIKTFTNLSQVQLPPTHNEIEVYIDDTAYLEVEQHSPYVKIAPGASYQWQVQWFPRIMKRAGDVQKWINKLENGIN